MEQWKIGNGCYRAEMLVRDDGSISLATLNDACNVSGHYVKVTTEQAISLARFLYQHVPGVAESLSSQEVW